MSLGTGLWPWNSQHISDCMGPRDEGIKQHCTYCNYCSSNIFCSGTHCPYALAGLQQTKNFLSQNDRKSTPSTEADAYWEGRASFPLRSPEPSEPALISRDRHELTQRLKIIKNLGWFVVGKVKFRAGWLAQTFHNLSCCLWWFLNGYFSRQSPLN